MWCSLCVCVCVSEDVGPTANAPCDSQDPVWLHAQHQCTHSIILAQNKQSASVLAHGMQRLSSSWHVHISLLTCSQRGAKPRPMSVTQAAPWMTDNHLWISAGSQLSSPRNWITALWSYMDGFTTLYEILNLHCNVLYILATHSVNCTFLHMWVQVCLLSQMCSWTSYTATATS